MEIVLKSLSNSSTSSGVLSISTDGVEADIQSNNFARKRFPLECIMDKPNKKILLYTTPAMIETQMFISISLANTFPAIFYSTIYPVDNGVIKMTATSDELLKCFTDI